MRLEPRSLASLRITILGMGLFAVGVMLNYDNPANVSVWVLVAPLFFLAVNLTAAIVYHQRIRKSAGLLVFHCALLGIVILAAIGRLTRFEAHLELAEGTAFSGAELTDVSRGPFHFSRLDRVNFVQGNYTVDYAPGMMRGLTRNQILVRGEGGQWQRRTIGDDRPLVLEGYRIYTTYNKGFAPMLTWTPDGGRPISGVINMPSYPLFEYKQDNQWTPPGGKPIRFWLQLQTGLDENAPWVLDGRKAKGVLVVTSGGRRTELQEGQSIALPGGRLRYDRLTTWMGYKIFYDPTLRWLFIVAIIGIAGLFAYYWRRLGLRTVKSGSAASETVLARRLARQEVRGL